MANKAHKLLTGTDLHEPKGVAGQPVGRVYVSDGAGSGVWTTINTDLQFSTGDLKKTYKSIPDAGWIMHTDGTTLAISSGATFTGSVYSALYILLWGIAASVVAGGRGGSAAADWAANKALTIPPIAGRVFGGAGSGSGLTTRALGSADGVETVTLSTSNLPAYTPTGSVSTSTSTTLYLRATSDGAGTGYQAYVPVSSNNLGGVSISATSVSSFSGNAQGGTSTAFKIVQPSVFFNVMLKV